MYETTAWVTANPFQMIWSTARGRNFLTRIPKEEDFNFLMKPATDIIAVSFYLQSQPGAIVATDFTLGVFPEKSALAPRIKHSKTISWCPKASGNKKSRASLCWMRPHMRESYHRHSRKNGQNTINFAQSEPPGMLHSSHHHADFWSLCERITTY